MYFNIERAKANSIKDVIYYLWENPYKSESEICEDVWGYWRGYGSSNKKYADLIRRGLKSGKICRKEMNKKGNKSKYFYYLNPEILHYSVRVEDYIEHMGNWISEEKSVHSSINKNDNDMEIQKFADTNQVKDIRKNVNLIAISLYEAGWGKDDILEFIQEEVLEMCLMDAEMSIDEAEDKRNKEEKVRMIVEIMKGENISIKDIEKKY